MIVKRAWKHRRYKYHGPVKDCEGWFLFGFIPLYIKISDWRY